MKKFFVILSLLFSTLAMHAQHVVIHNVDGADVVLRRDSVEKIEFVSGRDERYEAIDMGTSVLWSSVNLDLSQPDKKATSPEECGGYYGWGDPTGTHTSQYYIDYGGDTPPLDISGGLLDIAAQHWGDGWRMPTMKEYDELLTKCTWTWGDLRGMPGYLVTAKNGNTLFFPAAGQRVIDDVMWVGEVGRYWSSTLEAETPTNAALIGFIAQYAMLNYLDRTVGGSIRPVRIK